MSIFVTPRASAAPQLPPDKSGSVQKKAPRREPEKVAAGPLNPSLVVEGVEFVRVLAANELGAIRDEFLRTEKNFPEYKQKDGKNLYVLGGFAAYGNPSSFHNPFVRMLRRRAYDALVADGALRRFVAGMPALRGAADDYGVELLFDRMLHRHKDQSAGVELPHRDICPLETLGDNDTDLLLGGWINLSPEPQSFICHPGSHTKFKNSHAVAVLAEGKTGFSRLKEQDLPAYMLGRRVFSVPPGCMILFPQYLEHEIPKPGAPSTWNEQLRLFTCWRLTTSKELLEDGEKRRIVRDACSPQIPSDQHPPMFSMNHRSAFLDNKFRPGNGLPPMTMREWWQATFVDAVRDATEAIPGNKKGRRATAGDPKMFLSCLRDYGLHGPDYDYSEDDKWLMLRVHPLAGDQPPGGAAGAARGGGPDDPLDVPSSPPGGGPDDPIDVTSDMEEEEGGGGGGLSGAANILAAPVHAVSAVLKAGAGLVSGAVHTLTNLTHRHDDDEDRNSGTNEREE
jgi:hypothetical protein